MAHADPIDRIQWVDAATLSANLYNPNVVLQAEFSLLERSLLVTGWVQPILVTPARTVIDGFHRWKLTMESPAVRAKYGGECPVVVLDVSEGEAMLLTIRMNRAKGTHVGLRMSEIVQSLVDAHGFSLDRIAPEIGASAEEMKLLYAGGVFKYKATPSHVYSRSWAPAENGRLGVAEEAPAPSAPWDASAGDPPLADPVPCAYADVAPWIDEAARDGVNLRDAKGTRWWWIPGAGCASLLRLHRGAVQLKALWVRPELRGKGYGRLLRNQPIVAARAENVTLIEGHANRPDAYVKLGFTAGEAKGKHTVVRLRAEEPLTLDPALEG
jgi:GNAT superfamily N-acetyltransferase